MKKILAIALTLISTSAFAQTPMNPCVQETGTPWASCSPVTATNPLPVTFGTNPITITGILSAGGFNATGSTIPANGMYLGAANRLNFSTNSTLDFAGNGGIWAFGPTYSVPAVDPAVSINPRLYINSAGNGAALAIQRWTADALGPVIWMGKSRSATFGTQTVVQSGDNLGTVNFSGADGTVKQIGAQIQATVNGAPSSDMPTRLDFFTTPVGSTTPVLGLSLQPAGSAGSNGGVIISSVANNASVDSAGAVNVRLNVSGNNASASAMSAQRWTADAGGPSLWLGKSRSSTIGTQTVVQLSDSLGDIYFSGADGTVKQTGAKIGVVVDATPGATDMPGRMEFYTTPDGSGTPVRAMSIFNGGALAISSSVAINAVDAAAAVFARFNLAGTNASASSGSSQRYSADALGPSMWLGKSRGAAVGTETVVQSGDSLGFINFSGADGTVKQTGAQISADVDATPGSADMPGRLNFLTTPDGSGTPVLAMRINNAGLITVPLISTDATHTDSSVCQDTTTHALYAGSGALGVCLGTSSARYKENITSIDAGLKDILALKPVNFYYRKGYGDGGTKQQYGFIAEDVIHTLPRLTALDAKGRPNSVDYLAMVPILVKAIQEQQAQIEGLKQELKQSKGGK